MRLRVIPILLTGTLLAWSLRAEVASAQGQDTLKTTQKAAADLMTADKAVTAARNALQSARNNLDTNQFNSAAWNARVTKAQAATSKDQYDKAGPKEKEAALERYELALELAERRQAELEAAEKLLPQREAAAKAAEERYARAVPAAGKLAGSVKAMVREAENNLEEKVRLAKLAFEKAAFTKATADKTTANAASIRKAVTELAAADKAIREATAALEKATKDQPQRLKDVEKATKNYTAALQAVVKHIPALKTAQGSAVLQKVTADLVAADQTVRDTTAILNRVKSDLQTKTNAVKTAAKNAQAALEKVDKSIAKIAARKAAKFAQELVARAEKTRLAAEKVCADKTEQAERATQVQVAALQTAVKALASRGAEKALTAEKATLAKALADNETQLKKDEAATAREATEAKGAADKAEAARVAADKVVIARTATRQALERSLRQQHYRELNAAYTELVKSQQLATDKFLQPKVAALNKASLAYKNARAAATETASALAAAQAALQKAPAKDKKTAEKLVKTREAAWRAAEARVTATKAARDRARDEKKAEETKLQQYQVQNKAALAKVVVAKAAAEGGLKLLPESAWNYARARHLLVRAGFGGTPEEVARLHAMGLHGAVQHLVHYKDIPFDLPFASTPRERPQDYEKSLSGNIRNQLDNRRQQKEARQIQALREWWLRRMIESPRPLEEKLTLFWHGHFATQYSTAVNSHFMYLQNQLFRDNAAGNFATLLHGITHDAAMLNYLNNDTNVKGRANENLAREIMELFSMGRDQGYTEIDIRQGARALTGYTYDPWTGQFRFIETRHDSEPKTIFGKTGPWCGDDFANLILETPYPPKFIARQLFVFFAHDEPSLDTIEALANVLKANNYELAPLLENLFASEEFYSDKSMGTQIKGPVQLLVGLHRDLGLKDANLSYLLTTSNNMGQYLLEPPSVFGWPAGRTWINSTRVFIRYNALADILETVPRGGKSGVDIVGTLLAGKKFQSHAEVVDHLVRCCMTVLPSESKRQALIEFLKPLPPPDQWEAQRGPANARLTRLLAILICSPEYQLT